ncbi:MAG: tRNA pseudouridine(55) synthase TruB [Endozoicomonas sp. (ex Botrylloides leachii)]|nr:tRNA pseudouridine(55) synthase TruB [Endozoicomonas sp. (ex Botrylloides leachii)]
MPRRRHSRGRSVDGIVIVDKFKGASSNDVLQRVKRLFGAAKAGHTGSLDPLATGVLPICLGEATKFSQFLLESNKSYYTQVQLGVKTTTGDTEGEIIEERPIQVTRSDVEAVVARFQGSVKQVPSMYSALKHKGQPLYKLAREGIEVERPMRTVSIFRNELVSFDGNQLELEVDCSKGTYIRTLVEDIGDALGCLAHVKVLRRLKAGPYDQAQAYSLDDLEQIKHTGMVRALTIDQSERLERLYEQIDEASRDSLEEHQLQMLKELNSVRKRGANNMLDALLLPMDTAIVDWPEVTLGANASFYLAQGQPVLAPKSPTNGNVRIYSQSEAPASERRFLGVGEILDDGRVTPRRLVSSAL